MSLPFRICSFRAQVSSIRLFSQSTKDYFPPLRSRLLPDGALEGKIAFITGGGTGLGKGMAQMMSALGADVAISSRSRNL